MIASTSISTSISGATRAFTSTMVAAGRMSRKISPCALAARFPSADVGNEGPGAHHVAEARARLLQSAANVLQRLHRLRVHVTLAHDLAVRPGRDCARHRDEWANFDRAREADNRLVGRVTGDILAFHYSASVEGGIVPQARAECTSAGGCILAVNELNC